MFEYGPMRASREQDDARLPVSGSFRGSEGGKKEDKVEYSTRHEKSKRAWGGVANDSLSWLQCVIFDKILGSCCC